MAGGRDRLRYTSESMLLDGVLCPEYVPHYWVLRERLYVYTVLQFPSRRSHPIHTLFQLHIQAAEELLLDNFYYIPNMVLSGA